MMMDTEEISKMVDNIYKNILDKFNPAARQLISAGKVYLKALHGAAAASRMYVEALSKLARHSQQQGSWGGCSDISAALLQVVDVYKEVHEQQMNILKAFYVDLLVPLETNLEKDTKVVQLEQKKFNAQHKQRSESHSKAAALSRKQRKKNKNSTNDKDLKTLQRLEEEQSKLDAFREQSLRTALTQERRRYGFVLERQCSLAKHFMSLHTCGAALFQQRLPDWQRVARARESLPEDVQRMFSSRTGSQSVWADDDSYGARREDGSMASALRKTRSMDASALDIRCLSDAPEDQHRSTLSRARSDLNLSSRAHSPNGDSASPVRPQSLAVASTGRGWGSPLARALYAYLSSGENQLSFLEGDILALMGERNKGWQFGENLRTQTSGWFPLAYTELLLDDVPVSPRHHDSLGSTQVCDWRPPGGPVGGPGPGAPGVANGPRAGMRTPPLAPAPAPHTPTRSASGPLGALRPPPGPTVGVTVGASLHSSNDSGFSNEPPAAPEIDYSDDEPSRGGDSTPRANGSSSDSPRGSPRGSPGSEERALSNVKGWLLYKSALDLWDDVDTSSRPPKGGRPPPPPPPRVPPPPRPSDRPDRDRAVVHGASTLPSNARMRGRPLVPPPPPPPAESNGHAVVKRTKSLLKFRKDTSGDGSVLEGMSLWRHRSLVDVRDEEGEACDADGGLTPTLSSGLGKMKLVKIDIGDERPQLETQHLPRKHQEVNGHSNGHSNGHANGHANGFHRRRSDEDVEFVSVEEQTYSTLTKHGAAYFQKRVLERSKSARRSSPRLSRSDDDDDEPPYEDAVETRAAADGHVNEASITDKKREAARRAVAEAVRAAALRRQFGGDRLLTLPSRTRLAKSMSQELPSSNGAAGRTGRAGPADPAGSIFQYGKTLQSRLRAPDRGSRFDRLSITTGNLCGPWYDMWGQTHPFL